MTVPMVLSGNANGHLLAEVELSRFIEHIRRLSDERLTVYVLDKDGGLILHPDLTRITERVNFIERPLARRVINESRVVDGSDEAAFYRDAGGHGAGRSRA